MEKRIGKIKSASVGFGWYQDAMFGISFYFRSEKDRWGVGTFIGAWGRDPDENCKWTKEDQTKHWGEMCRKISETLQQSNARSVDELVGKPVEVTFKGNCLESWRILTEAI